MLNAMVGGQKDPEVLANLARMSLRNKTSQLTAALTGQFTDHHAFLVRLDLQVIDQLAAAVAELTEQIETAIAPLRPVVTLRSHPGAALSCPLTRPTYISASATCPPWPSPKP